MKSNFIVDVLNDRTFKRTLKVIVLLTILLLLISLLLPPLSDIFFSKKSFSLSDLRDYYSLSDSIILIIVVIFGILIGALVTLFCIPHSIGKNGKGKFPNLNYTDVWEGLKSPQTWSHTTKGFVGAFLVIGFIFILSGAILSSFIDSNGSFNLVTRILENPGGIFAFVTGVFTLLGTYVALQSILEMKRTITSYPQLLNRITELIVSIKDPKEEVKILCYFPLPGNWQVKSDTIKDGFENALKKKDTKIRIICLCNVDHLRFLLTIAKRKNEIKNNTISADKILDFQIRSEQLLQIFCKDTSLIEVPERLKKDVDFLENPIQLSVKNIPPYYFFVSDHRAIIVTPVGLPVIDESITMEMTLEVIKLIREYKILTISRARDEREEGLFKKTEILKQIENLIIPKSCDSKTKNDIGAHVETLGFETSDRVIIQKLQDIFEDLSCDKTYSCDKDRSCKCPCNIGTK